MLDVIDQSDLLLPAPASLTAAVAVAKRIYSGSQRLFEECEAAGAEFHHLFFTLTSEAGSRSFPFAWRSVEEEAHAGKIMRGLAARQRGYGLWGVMLITHVDVRLISKDKWQQLGLATGPAELTINATAIDACSTRQEALAVRLETYMGDWHEVTAYDRSADKRISWRPPQPLNVVEVASLTGLLPPPPHHAGSA